MCAEIELKAKKKMVNNCLQNNFQGLLSNIFRFDLKACVEVPF